MRKLYLPIGFLTATTALACSFHVGTSSDPATPQASPPAASTTAAPSATPTTATPAPAPTPTLPPNAKVIKLAKRPTGGSTTAPAGTTTGSGSTASSGPDAVMSGPNAFGTGTPTANGFAGAVYVLPAGTTKLPDLDTLTPIGTLFTGQLNTPETAMTGGFPGLDATRNENFALRFQAPLVVANEGIYTLRVASDDGAVVKIDGMTIVDNDGSHTLQSKSGPVNLVKGTHLLTVDYFQTTGKVALQLFCKHGDAAEIICPTQL